jgi:hypothetical protein
VRFGRFAIEKYKLSDIVDGYGEEQYLVLLRPERGIRHNLGVFPLALLVNLEQHIRNVIVITVEYAQECADGGWEMKKTLLRETIGIKLSVAGKVSSVVLETNCILIGR